MNTAIGQSANSIQPPMPGIVLEIVDAALDRADAEPVDDEKRLELGLDREQAGDAREHAR